MSRGVAQRAQDPVQSADASPPPPAESLFRTEAMAEQQSQWLGTVLIAPKLSGTLFALFALAATADVLGLLFFASYSHKARISGWLTPEFGIMRVYAPQAGRIAQLHVHEGSEVKRGDPLAVVSTELESEALGRTRQAAVAQLIGRRDSLISERDRQRGLFALQEREFADRIGALKAEQGHLVKEVALQRSRLELADQANARLVGLRAKGITTETAVQDADRDRLRIAADIQDLERDGVRNTRERLETEARIRELPLTRDAKIAEIDRDVSALSQEIVEAEAQREIVITAPQDGAVTAVLGGGARTDAPLLSIVPVGSKLTAELFTTSRSIGFVRPGQEVLLRYQAYPYQKFGAYRGTVSRISRSAVSPSELSPQLAGLTSMFAADEPVYRIEVAPERQTATAYGQPVLLQAGMQLEADILIERRRLYEWMLDPLFTLTGRWRS